MKKGVKGVIITAAIFISMGLTLAIAGMALMDFDWFKLSTVQYEEVSHKVTESFDSLDIRDVEYDIRILRSSDGECRVVCKDSEKIYHTLSVTGGMLTVNRVDERMWFERIGIFWTQDLCVTVYLPKAEYDRLLLKSVSGDVKIDPGFTFSRAEVSSTSGDIHFAGNVIESLTAKSVSGNVTVRNTFGGSVSVSSTSGELNLHGVTCRPLTVSSTSGEVNLSDITASLLTASSTSGDIELSSVLSSGEMAVTTVSGEIELHRCDGESLQLKSSSGDIGGTLLTGKTFVTKTTSGDIRVPAESVGGRCEIITASGDIAVCIAD